VRPLPFLCQHIFPIVIPTLCLEPQCFIPPYHPILFFFFLADLFPVRDPLKSVSTREFPDSSFFFLPTMSQAPHLTDSYHARRQCHCHLLISKFVQTTEYFYRSSQMPSFPYRKIRITTPATPQLLHRSSMKPPLEKDNVPIAYFLPSPSLVHFLKCPSDPQPDHLAEAALRS